MVKSLLCRPSKCESIFTWYHTNDCKVFFEFNFLSKVRLRTKKKSHVYQYMINCKKKRMPSYYLFSFILCFFFHVKSCVHYLMIKRNIKYISR